MPVRPPAPPPINPGTRPGVAPVPGDLNRDGRPDPPSTAPGGTSNPGVAPGMTPTIPGSDPKPGFFSQDRFGGGLLSGAQMAAGTVGAGWLLNAVTGRDTTGLGAIGGGIGDAIGGIGEGLGDVATGAGSALQWLPMMAVAGVGLFLFMELRKK